MQTDNLRAVCLVVSLSLHFTTRQTAHKLRLTAALCEKNMSDVILFQLKSQPGFFDGTCLSDSELASVPMDTVCLSLENASITDNGIANLPKLEQLRCIDLDSTKITDLSMEIISSYKNLEEIWIEDTQITDVGFKKLALLKRLKYVSFWDTDISDNAYNYVVNKLPNLKSEG